MSPMSPNPAQSINQSINESICKADNEQSLDVSFTTCLGAYFQYF